MAVWSQVNFVDLPRDIRFDAEFFQPNYLAQQDAITRSKHATLNQVAAISDGNHVAISESYCDDGVRYLRGQDLKDFFIADSDPIFIPYPEYDRLKRSHMKPGDVLVGIVGTIGSVGLVTDRHGLLTGNCKLAIIRPRSIEPEYLAAYLASRLGQNEIRRRTRGTVQMGLILPDLGGIPVPLLEEDATTAVANSIRESYAKRQESVALYATAENLYLSEVGLGELGGPQELFYKRDFSETQHAGRLDAEFFQPAYRDIMDGLKSTRPERIVPLKEFLSLLTNGHTPRYHDLSEGDIPFLTAEHVFDFRIDYDSDKRIRKEHHNGELKRTRLRRGDCLITIKGRIGNAAIAEDLKGPVNINQDVALFRLNGEMPPYYLMAYLNSKAGQAFTRQYCTGQINPFLGLGNLRQLPVPVYEIRHMERIAAKTEEIVLAARAARDASRHLLEKGKRMVEEAVIKRGSC